MNEIKEQLFIVQGCVIHQGSVLLIQRNEPEIPEIHGNWELPGGKVRFGEAPIHAAIREIREETGVIANQGKLLPHIHTAIRKPTDSLHIQPIILCYFCEPLSVDLEQVKDQKINRAEWIPLKQLDPLRLQTGSFDFIQKGYQEFSSTYSANAGLSERLLDFEACLHLTNIDPKTNRQIFWKIQVLCSFKKMDVFQLRLHWGYYNGSHQKRTINLHSRSKLIHFLNTRLQEKHRKGYKIVKKSENFPYIRRLRDFPIERSASRQLTLF
ncbi:MAG: NUDIX domain-containing protein [Bacteroidota bacterium]